MQPRFISTICAALVWLTIAAVAPVAAGSPALHLPERVHTFDPVVDGTVVNHTFVLQNRGSAPLEISRVRTG